MTDESVFDRDPADWSDAEIRVGLAACGQRHEELKPELAIVWPGARYSYELAHEIACVLADERDRRKRLYAEMDAAANPFAAGEACIWSED